MAIKILRKGLPVIGYAKIGANHPKGGQMNGAPYKFDHIELTGRLRDKDGNLVPDKALMQAMLSTQGVTTCGGCDRSKKLGFPDGLPTRIGVLVPYNDLELVFPNRLAYYRGRTAYCVGDGEEAMRRPVVGKKTKKGGGELPVYGEPAPHAPCGSDCPDFQSRRCKPNAKLRFIPATDQRVGGVFEFRTTSWNSIPNIQESLEEIKLLTGGVLQWIPLVFEIAEQTVVPKDGGTASKAMIASVMFPGGPQKLLEVASETLRLRAPLIQEVRQLEANIQREAAWEEPPEEIAAVQREFYQNGDDDPEADPDSEPVASEPPPEVAPESGEGRSSASAAPESRESDDSVAPEPAQGELLDAAPAPARDGDSRPRIDVATQGKLLAALASNRAMRLGMGEEDGPELLASVLRELEIPSLADVRLPDEMNAVMDAIKGCEVERGAA